MNAYSCNQCWHRNICIDPVKSLLGEDKEDEWYKEDLVLVNNAKGYCDKSDLSELEEFYRFLVDTNTEKPI